jgi:hypothetical protein
MEPFNLKDFSNSFEESKACAILPLDSLAHFGCWDSGTSDAKVFNSQY